MIECFGDKTHRRKLKTCCFNVKLSPNQLLGVSLFIGMTLKAIKIWMKYDYMMNIILSLISATLKSFKFYVFIVATVLNILISVVLFHFSMFQPLLFVLCTRVLSASFCFGKILNK